MNWIRPRRCDSNGCVEAARRDDLVLVRDTTGAVATYTLAEWAAFVDAVKDGQYDFEENDRG